MALACATGCVHARQPPAGAVSPIAGADFLGEGLASFYGPGLYGHRTANGERLEPGTMTAAHRTLRFGTCVRVVNVQNGKSVQVRVNDRGPYVAGRIMDVSEAAARALGMRGQGVARVRLFRCGAEVSLTGCGPPLEAELAAWR